MFFFFPFFFLFSRAGSSVAASALRALMPLFDHIATSLERLSGASQSLRSQTIVFSAPDAFPASARTYAIVAPSGTVVLNSRWFADWDDDMTHSMSVATKLFARGLSQLNAGASPSAVATLCADVLRQLPSLLVLPLWACILCTVVLAITLPFVFNFGVFLKLSIVCVSCVDFG